MIIKEKLNTATVGIEDLLTKAESIKAKSDDYILRKPKIRENIWFEDDGKINFISDEGCKISASLSEHAIGQLAAYHGWIKWANCYRKWILQTGSGQHKFLDSQL